MLKCEVYKKIKVLHVVGGMTSGGLETLIMNIYREIDREKFHFDFAVQTTESCFYDEEIRKMGGRIISHPKPRKGLKNYKKALEKTLNEYGPYDVVHSHVLFFSGYVLQIAKNAGVPIRIAHSHSTHDSKGNSLIRRIYRNYMTHKIKSNSTKMLGCSIAACKALFGVNPEIGTKVEILPNAIPLKSYELIRKNQPIILEEINVTERNGPIIGHIGRFTDSKNHKFILEIFAKFLLKEKTAKLIFVGEGPLRPKIEQIVLDKEIEQNVFFLGARKDVPNVLGTIDLLLFPSLYEGLGMVLIEAQAAGVPCVTSNRVPREADLGLNLVDFLSLDINLETWVSSIECSLKKSIPEWALRKRILDAKGYSINSLVSRIESIYKSK